MGLALAFGVADPGDGESEFMGLVILFKQFFPGFFYIFPQEIGDQ